MKRILPYSAIKRKANKALPYSILNPETNSDSPSARSKGARLVSAKQIVSHIGTMIKIIGEKIMCCKFIESNAMQIETKMIPIEIS